MGGALFNNAGTVTLSQVSFSGNHAQGGDSHLRFPGSGYGGALFNYTGQMTLNFVTVAGNTVTGGQYKEISGSEFVVKAGGLLVFSAISDGTQS